MKTLFVVLLIMLIAIPLFAVFQLLHRIEHSNVNKNSDEEFYNALRMQYGLDKEQEKPKRALTADERIALAKRISDDPFADVKAEDVMEELPEETPAAEADKAPEPAAKASSDDSEVKNEKTAEEAPAQKASEEKPEEGKMTREQAIALVSGMLGSDKKKKGSAYASLQETLAKYQNQTSNKK